MLRVSLIQRNKARNIMTWYARVFDTETKEIRYVSMGTTKKTEAACIMQAKIAAGEFETRTGDRVTIGMAVDAYLKHLETKGSNLDTQKTAMNAISCLFQFKDVPISELDRKALHDSFAEREKDNAPSTWNEKRTFVKTCLKYAIDYFALDMRNPADIIPQKKNRPKEKDFWTPEQIERILECATEPRKRLLWALMAFAGLRIHEALKSRPEDVRDGYLYVVGKGEKPAKIPVSSRLAEEIERAGEAWDFTGMSRNLKALIAAAKKAVPEGFAGKATNHRLRHSFASNLIRNGCNPKSAQKLLRHSDISTTLRIYSHVMEEDLKDDIEKMFRKDLTGE